MGTVNRRTQLMDICNDADQEHLSAIFTSDDLNEEHKKTIENALIDLNIRDSCAQYRAAMFYHEHLKIDQKEGDYVDHPPTVFESSDPIFKSVDVKDISQNGKLNLPPVASPTFKLDNMPPEWKPELTKRGLQMIRQGKVACILLAGGQGTRLGYDGPKGCYDVNLPSHKSLFHIIADRINRVARNAAILGGCQKSDVHIPFYIMTAFHNHTKTVEHFMLHDFFGLNEYDVIFFKQTIMPCFTPDGKIIMADELTPAANPNGNGGVFESLRRTGALENIRKRNVELVHVFGVDNILVKCADPMFIGLLALTGGKAANKCVAKAYPEEPIGVMCEREDKLTGQRVPTVVEYTELSPEDQKRRKDPNDPNSAILYSSGNICNHLFTLDFIDEILRSAKFQYHIAHKKIPYYDHATKCRGKPGEPNGVKLEYFIFDAFLVSPQVVVLETFRNTDFSPVKNATGVDSPETARRDYDALSRQWAAAAGAHTVGNGILEISPLMSYEGEGLESIRGKILRTPITLEPEGP